MSIALIQSTLEQYHCSIQDRISLAPGVAAQSIQWGAWRGVGMVAGNTAVQTRMLRSGIGTVSPAMGLGAMERILLSASAPAQVCPVHTQHDTSRQARHPQV